MATTDLSTPSSTQGWKFNHIGIRVADLEKSLFFYEAVLGMKDMTRMAMDTITFVLLGYPEGGDSLFAREGVLELVWSEVSPLLFNCCTTQGEKKERRRRRRREKTQRAMWQRHSPSTTTHDLTRYQSHLHPSHKLI